MSRSWIYPCFFLSGFSGLVNEIVWSRLFVYTMGSSNLSIAVVVSMFMGGLALGSWRGGPLADRANSPLRLYGWLVLLAGALSGAVAPLLWILEPVLGVAYRLHDGDPGHPLFTVVKVVVCAGTILVPTTLMGATLPALTKHLTRNEREIGSRIGNLYAVNTFGAVAGAAAAGFFLIGMVGLGWSAALGASVDVLVGLLVLWMTRGVPLGIKQAHKLEQNAPLKILSESSVPGPQAASLKPQADRERVPIPVKIAVLAFGISGFANMCLQFGWTRSIIISIGNSTYGFSVIVGIFIFGLAAGGAIAGLFADRLKRPMAAFGWLLVATAVAAGLTIPLLGLTPAYFSHKIGTRMMEGGVTYSYFLAMGAWSVVVMILPSTVLMGMSFPLVARLRTLSAGGVGKAVGVAYAANTVGAILGTALTGFVLVPLFGRTWLLLYLAVGLSFLAGVMVLLAAPGPRRLVRHLILGTVTASLLAVFYVTRPSGVLDSPKDKREYWNPVLFARGAYTSPGLAARLYPSASAFARAMIDVWVPLYYRDGEAASVAILTNREKTHICLNINGKTDASAGESFSFDIQTQLLMGHLPLLIHPAPRRALNLGLGGGMSLGAMTTHDELESIDLLELSPEVVEATRTHFAHVNRAAVDNPKVRTVIGDGRNHLTHTLKTYDVISSEPSNFWIAGLGNLFTEDFYRLVQKRLNKGGLVCQWIYGYNIRLEDYKIALRTILRVFPHVTVWTNSYGDTLLLGSMDPIVFDRNRIAEGLAGAAVKEDLAPIGIVEPEDLFRYFQTDGKALEGWVGDGPTNTDLFPVLEFRSPLGFFDKNPDISVLISKASPEVMATDAFHGFSTEQIEAARARRALGHSLIRFFHRLTTYDMNKGSYDYDGALEEYRIFAQAGDDWTLDSTSRKISEAAWEMGDRRTELLRTAREIHDAPELCMADEFRSGPKGDAASQLKVYLRAAEVAPATRWEPYFALARVQAQHNQPAEALKSLEIAQRRRAPLYKIAFVRGVAMGMMGDLGTAEKWLREALALTPPSVEQDQGEGGSKLTPLEQDRGEATYNLAYCLEQRARFEEAVGFYRQAMALKNDPVRAGIAQARCLRKQGDYEGAVEAATLALTTARTSNRESGEARAEIARARAAAGSPEEAMKWMQSAVQAAPGRYERELEELRARTGR